MVPTYRKEYGPVGRAVEKIVIGVLGGAAATVAAGMAALEVYRVSAGAGALTEPGAALVALAVYGAAKGAAAGAMWAYRTR